MKLSRFLAYSSLIILVAAGAIWYIVDGYYDSKPANRSQQGQIVMYKNESCQCCERWANYMRQNGYSVESNTSRSVAVVKSEKEIPQDMGACHTAVIDGYVVEGHVPVEDVHRMLQEQPEAKGIAVAGMPASSPGMNTALNEPFKVHLLKNDGSTEIYAQH